MTEEELRSEIPGAKELIAWFGRWPTFHDAEVLSVHLNRKGPSFVRIHTFEVTKRTDSNGHYVRVKHVTVTFVLEDVDSLELDGFNNQNVLAGLSLNKAESGYELTLEGIFGVGGTLSVAKVRIELEPGMPVE